MSACGRQIFKGVSDQTWAAIVRTVKDKTGVAVDVDEGSAGKDGFVIAWRYARAKGELTTQCMDSPWWVPCGLITTKIKGLVDDCRVAAK